MNDESNQDVFYSLNIADIQGVAEQQINRELTREELQKIIDSIADKINWYDAIADTINEKIEMEELS